MNNYKAARKIVQEWQIGQKILISKKVRNCLYNYLKRSKSKDTFISKTIKGETFIWRVS